MTAQLAVAAGIGLTATVATEPLVVGLLRRRDVLDLPNDRSSHSRPIPRGGGIGLVVGICSGTLVGDLGTWILALLVVAFAVLGFVDDLSPLSARRRLWVQLVLGGVAGFLTFALVARPTRAPWLGVSLAILAIPAVVNAVNFMDGIDGITALNALVASVLFTAEAVHLGEATLAVLACATGAAALGFLPWNLPKAQVFLGDVGSYAIGASLGLCSYGLWLAGALPIAAVGPLVLYLADTGSSLMRRVWRREPILEPHRSHTYQQLVDLGFSHLRVAFTTAVMSGLIGLIAIGIEGGMGFGWRYVGVSALTAAYLLAPTIVVRLQARDGNRG